MNSTLGLATYIGFSDLNRVNENWSLDPAGTVLVAGGGHENLIFFQYAHVINVKGGMIK